MKTQLTWVMIGMIHLSCSAIIHASETSVIEPDAVPEIIMHKNGNSIDPIKFDGKGIKNLEDLRNSQYAYIDKYYKNYKLIGGYTKKRDNTFIRRILIEKDGKTIAIEFDVTECFKKLKAKNKAIKLELDNLEKELAPPENIGK